VELKEKSAAWQRKEGKNPTGGLNAKGRKSYERENPGSDLKAPQPEGGPRKRSFCARMGGVKGPMKDEKGRPTRKALALRKWKCSEDWKPEITHSKMGDAKKAAEKRRKRAADSLPPHLKLDVMKKAFSQREFSKTTNETTKLKDELISTAERKHKEAKKKKFKDFMAQASEVKKKGVKFYDKKGSGYIKAGKKKYTA
tara:strand:- start:994 stop:1587 length:594 start_codon:yes stop_codon:yes gene_type:complete